MKSRWVEIKQIRRLHGKEPALFYHCVPDKNPEMEALLAVLRRERSDWPDEIDQKRLHRLLAFHRMVPQLSRFISLDGDLSRSNKANQIRSLQLTQMLLTIEEALFDFDVIHLKGVVLAKHLFEDVAARSAGDIDFWIQPEHVDEAHEIFVALGFRCVCPYGSLRRHYREKYRLILNHMGYLRDDGILIELHWRPFSAAEFFPFSFRECFENGTDLILGGQSVRTLSNLHLPLFLHLHAAKHSWERLCWLYDLAKLHENNPESMSVVLDQATQFGLDRPVEAGLGLCNQLLGLSMHHKQNSWMLNTGRAQLMKREALRVNKSILFKIAWKMSDGMGYRLRLLRTYLVWPDDWGSIQFPKCLFFLQYFLRPYYWLLRRTKM